MTKAVVYTSSGGHTAEYAKMFGESTGLPVYSLKEAKRELAEGTLVMYFGWIMGGRVQGYRRAAKRFRIRGVCAVGLDGSLNQITQVREVNRLTLSVPVFTMQGGLELKKLRGFYKLAAAVMSVFFRWDLFTKQNRTPHEDDMLEILRHGGSRVSFENLGKVLAWYNYMLSENMA